MNVPTAAPLAQAAPTTTPPVSVSTFQPKPDVPIERAETVLEQRVTQVKSQVNRAVPPARKLADVDEPVVQEVPATPRPVVPVATPIREPLHPTATTDEPVSSPESPTVTTTETGHVPFQPAPVAVVPPFVVEVTSRRDPVPSVGGKINATRTIRLEPPSAPAPVKTSVSENAETRVRIGSLEVRVVRDATPPIASNQSQSVPTPPIRPASQSHAAAPLSRDFRTFGLTQG